MRIGGIVLSKLVRFGFLAFALFLVLMLTLPVLQHEKNMSDIYVFGMGKADSVLIKSRGQTLLIDAGHKRDKKELADKLRTLGIRKLDVMILSHPDKDHIGGASYLIDNFAIDQVIYTAFEKGSKEEAALKNSLDIKAVETLRLDKDYFFELGHLQVQLFLGQGPEIESSNDHSITALIKDRDLHYFFGADAEGFLLAELMEKDLPKIDFYKVAHHGRKNDQSQGFIDLINPGISIITNTPAESDLESLLPGQVYFAFGEDLRFSSDGRSIRKR